MIDEYNSITLEQLKKITEDQLMFITFPGRMGDEYGCTFVIGDGKSLCIYRIDDLDRFKYNIYRQFPRLIEALNDHKGRESMAFKGIYMGYGNKLFVNKSVYDDYKKELDDAIKKEIEKMKVENDYDESLKDYYPIMLCFTQWEKALVYYSRNKGLDIKNIL